MRIFSLLIALLTTVNLFALECNTTSFKDGDIEVKKIHLLYDSTPQSINNPTNMDTANLHKEEYQNRLNELEKQLVDLTKNHSDLFKARLLNQENLQRWKLLEKTCENESLLIAKKGRYDAEIRSPLIQTQMSSIQENIKTVKIIMDTTKEEFQKLREK